jgi:hypothetical protein
VWDAERSQQKSADGSGNPATPAGEPWPLPDAAERKRYHTEKTVLAVQQKQWFAAEFHLGRVLRDDPRDAVVEPQIAALLKERLAALLAGKDEPGINTERLAVAHIAYCGQHYADATRLWARALASDPKLGDDRVAQHRYHAACAAALAAAGQGKDLPLLDAAAQAKLRGQTLDWLRAELTAWGKEQPRPAIAKALGHWQQDSALASLRDPLALANLPAAERKAFTQLWADVAALLQTRRGAI